MEVVTKQSNPTASSLINSSFGLKRWLGGYNHWLLSAEDLSLIPSTHMAAAQTITSFLGDLMPSSGYHRYCKLMVHRHTCKKTHMHKINVKIKKK